LDKIGREYPISTTKSTEPSAEGAPFWVANGVTAPEGTVAKADMITGVYWTKTYPPEPYLFDGLLRGSYKKWTAGDFFPIDLAGCDCLLIDTEVLRRTPFPWFSTDWVWTPESKPSSIATEDFYFFTKARKYGFRLFADTSIQCAHEERSTGAMFGLTMDMVQAGGKPDMGDSECLVADLGAGLSTHPSLFGSNAKIVRFDMRQDTHPDVVCDIRSIPEQHFGLYDYVTTSHVLEHFRREEAVDLVTHWTKLLKVGGTLITRVPNFEHAVKMILYPPSYATADDKKYAWAQVYGDQGKPGAPWQHLNGFTSRKLQSLLSVIPGLSEITVVEEDGGLNLKAEGKKAFEPQPEALTEMWDEIGRLEGSLIQESALASQVVEPPQN
jgi:hypothetical protein